LKNTFKKNGYSKMEIQHALHPKEQKKPMTSEQKQTGTAIIPYMQTVLEKISTLLAKDNLGRNV
jgi:hypothetical protein